VDVPTNDGCFRPIRIVVPQGSVLFARPPAACAARGMTGHRIPDLIFGALAQALPDRIPAASQGGTSTGRFGVYAADGRADVFYDNVYGTRGATPRNDGPDGLAELGGNLSNVSIEAEEAAFPLRIRRYGYMQDSEGAGKFRGSLSIVREWEVLAPEMSVTFRSDRRTFPPYGLFGGESGRPSMTYLNPDHENRVLPSKINMRLHRGDVLAHHAPSGGGWGNPLEREPNLVLQDWRLEKVSAEHARDTYGVVIDERNGQVDVTASADLRQERTQQRGRAADDERGP